MNEEIEINEIETQNTEEIVSGDDVASASVSSVENEHASEIPDGVNWYIVQCFTGQEYKVLSRIQQLMETPECKKHIFRALVPEEQTVEIKNNKRLEKTTKIYPGYAFVQMTEDEYSRFEIRRLPGVSKFIGPQNKPTSVTEADILKVLRKAGDTTKKIDVDFETGEVLKVIAGPFRGYTGTIAEVNGDRGKLKVMISIFGRETPVELEFDQVEKTVQ